MTAELVYWDIRGLAQPIRYVLAYAKKDYVDGTVARNGEWPARKHTLGLDFPNLPYYIDGDVKLTQSSAILRHLARRHNLYGTSEAERDSIDLLYEQLVDVREAWVSLCYDPEFDAKKGAYLEKTMPANFKLLDTFLGKHKFAAADHLSFVDFIAYEVFDQHRKLVPDVLKDYPNLQSFVDKIEALPELKEALEKKANRPLNGPSAKFR